MRRQPDHARPACLRQPVTSRRLIVVLNEKLLEVMSEPGKAMMGTAVAGGPDRANKAADSAVACPLLEASACGLSPN